jgi:hypothetical protein
VRSRATLAASTATRGLPRRFPFALAELERSPTLPFITAQKPDRTSTCNPSVLFALTLRVGLPIEKSFLGKARTGPDLSRTGLNRWLRAIEKNSDQITLPPDAGFGEDAFDL